ncbi:2'-5' RNA ligase family protein [Aeromicrobium fastidiosum]|uniref:2'-5' RNA ligase family protein n=1 Tax=Aeromicrobium fastidiosum TaxID=52699 RepID=A0A641ASX1_9ACTN|nr:2'-5' RNA ligase family protein [Aeromicrobium fastidiosum]KAA1380161.1 2'-5' RNA ligase family protein [Aeromicrobium fastidiosum]MBP2389697.1 2'-5' RNA ligase [Aeromicrobium fastidiosum]
MVQSVELVLDEGLDARVREEWAALRDAGLPSQARHTGASNAPHVTVGVADLVDAEGEAALAGIDYGPDSPLRLGGLLVFGGRTSVLSRAVVPTAGLIATHLAVQAALDGAPGRPDTTRPGAWTPHVTLARRLDPDQLAAALSVLADRPRELVGTIRGARRWDGDARATRAVGTDA